MIRYVDIDAFEEELSKETADYSEMERWSGADYSWMWRKKFYEVFETFPAADVEEVRHGHWVYEKGDCFPKCSVCGQHHGTLFEHYYCPVCGAKMSLGEE